MTYSLIERREIKMVSGKIAKKKKKPSQKKYRIPEPDGKKAYLPQPLMQGMPFLLSRKWKKEGQEGKGRSIIKRRNSWGDLMIIESRRPLLVSPDMGIFVAVIALCQHHGIRRLIEEDTGNPSHRLVSRFPISELYEITGMRRGQARIALLDSMECLGSTSISVRYAVNNNKSRHANKPRYSLTSFWDIFVDPRKGRAGSLVTLYLADAVIPRRTYLWADAGLCNRLRRDTARAIFWSLLSREHFGGTLVEWQQLIGGESGDIWHWRDRQFLPALEELASHGYDVRGDENDGIYVVTRPKNPRVVEGR